MRWRKIRRHAFNGSVLDVLATPKTLPASPLKSRPASREKVLPLLGVVLAWLAGAGCKRPESTASQPPDIVAEVGDVAITRSQLLVAWERRAKTHPTNVPPSAVLSELVDDAATYVRARNEGFLDRPEVQTALRQLVVSRYREACLATNATPIEPSESAVRVAYESQTNAMVRPPAFNVAIFLHEVPRRATPEKRREARERVEGWRAEVLRASDPAAAFASLVAERSADKATRYRRGEVGWASMDEFQRRFPAEVATAVRALRPGDTSDVVETPQGLYLVRVLGQRPASVRAFEEAAPQIRHQLREQNRFAREASIRSAARMGIQIRTNATLLASLAASRPPQRRTG